MAAIGAVIGGGLGVMAALLVHVAALDVSPVGIYFLCGVACVVLAVAARLADLGAAPDAAG